MKSKAPLMMIEQMVMLLVFALASVLCLQAFILSQELSGQSIARDRAVMEAQNAAEILKSGSEDTYFAEMKGQTDGQSRVITYDENWEPLDMAAVSGEDASFVLTVSYTDSGQKLLRTADIVVRTSDGEKLFALQAAWQKEVKRRG